MPITYRRFIKPFDKKLIWDSQSYVAGIDGCPAGWCVALLTLDAIMVDICATWTLVMQRYCPPGCHSARAQAIAVDMPIGLIDCGRRPCDVLARKVLHTANGTGVSSSSVFAPPRRPMLAFSDYQDANAWGKAQGPVQSHGGGLSKQAWNIRNKIQEIDNAIGPSHQDVIIEAHPELAFLVRNNNIALPVKKSAHGRGKRRNILKSYGIPVDEILSSLADQEGVAEDDILDACILSLVAEAKQNQFTSQPKDKRKKGGHENCSRAKCLTGKPERDGRGLRMEIWY